LRTLGGVAGQITASPEGLVAESIWAINPEGGDPALANYILCQTCTVSSPFLAPSGAVSVSSAHIPWRELYSYAQTWVTDLEAITGETVDIKQILKDEFNFDIDVGLLNWLGSDFHTVVLEPISPNLKTLLYSPAQFTFVPVSSVEAAQAGIAELSTHIAPLLSDLMTEFGSGNQLSDALGMNTLADGFVTRSYDYKGSTINRVQFSLNGDIGYTFVGNYLVVGSPAKALEKAVDTFLGGRPFTSDALYRAAKSRTDMPQAATVFGVSEGQSSVYGLADILETISQPLAFGVSTGLQTGLNDNLDDFFNDRSTYEPYYADIQGINPEAFSVPGDLLGSLNEGEEDNLGYFTDFYQLNDLHPGDTVSVTLSSADFDTYLYLINATNEEYLNENDDALDNFASSELSFSVEEGKQYWLEVSSYDGSSTGDYVLTVLVNPGDGAGMADNEAMSPKVSTPSFAELLELFELLPNTVRIVGDHLSTSDSFSSIDENTVYSRSTSYIRW
jgi:hypothetical protein